MLCLATLSIVNGCLHLQARGGGQEGGREGSILSTARWWVSYKWGLQQGICCNSLSVAVGCLLQHLICCSSLGGGRNNRRWAQWRAAGRAVGVLVLRSGSSLEIGRRRCMCRHHTHRRQHIVCDILSLFSLLSAWQICISVHNKVAPCVGIEGGCGEGSTVCPKAGLVCSRPLIFLHATIYGLVNILYPPRLMMQSAYTACQLWDNKKIN